MAQKTSVLSNSHYNLRVTYDISGGQVIFYKIEGMSTDGYESHGYSSALYLNSSVIFSSGTVRFPGNYYYTIWESTGGWGTSVFAGYFYATACGGASNLKFWYDFDVPSYTLTLKTSTGVDSFTGGGKYKSGTAATTKATASAGYTLSKYTGTANDGTTGTWTGCAGKTSHTDTWTIERNRIITAYATPNTYTVTYAAGGGTGSMSSSTATFGANFKASANKFTRSGYEFTGWKDSLGSFWSKDGPGVASYWKWNYTQNITLTAQWKKATEVLITYNGNGGLGNNGETSYEQTSTVGSTLTLFYNKASEANPTSGNTHTRFSRKGYEFVGWSTNPDATAGSNSWASTTYNSSYKAVKNDNNTTVYYWKGTWTTAYNTSYTLYAIWKPLTYTLTFNENGGTNNLPGEPLSQTVTYDNIVAVWRNRKGGTGDDKDDEWFSRIGYEFVGWGTYSQKDQTSGTSWASIDLDDVMTPAAEKRGDTYITSINKEGRTVYYWKGKWIYDSATLYALWRPYGKFTKTLGTGVDWVTGGEDTVGYKYDKEVTFEAKAKAGYVLDYYTVDDGNPIQLSGSQQTFNISATDKTIQVKVYATPITYTINYDANGGTGEPESGQKKHGETYRISSITPTKSDLIEDGYTVTFNGNGGTSSYSTKTAKNTISYPFSIWKDESGSNYASGGSYTKNQNDTLTAQYTTRTAKGSITTATATRSSSTSTRTVTYNAGEGSCDKVNDKSTATITYTCDGWMTSSSGSTIKVATNTNYTPESNETLYAHWKSTTGTYNSITLPYATKEGYNFLGWARTSGGTVAYQGGQVITPTSTMTLYAKFEIAANTYIKVNGEWLLGEIYVKDNGTWKKGQAYTKDTTWKK